MQTMKKKRKSTNVENLSERSGLVFPVEHIQQMFPQAVDEEAAVFVTGVLEFLVAEILTLAGQGAEIQQSNKITIHLIPGLQDKRTYARLLELSKEEEEVEEKEEAT